MKLPCDDCIWSLIPMIKRELVLKLHKKHKISMAKIARKLEITRGAVTQYMQGKRAVGSFKLRKVKSINDAISELANNISSRELSQEDISKNFCRICKIAQKELLP